MDSESLERGTFPRAKKDENPYTLVGLVLLQDIVSKRSASSSDPHAFELTLAKGSSLQVHARAKPSTHTLSS